MKLMVQLEGKDGGKFNTTVDVPGDKLVKNVSIALSNFVPSNDLKAPNNTLNLDQVNQIVMADLSGILENTDQDNTVWINNIKASPAK